jgi:hypothetical protein
MEAKFGPPNYREGKIKMKVAKFRDKRKVERGKKSKGDVGEGLN